MVLRHRDLAALLCSLTGALLLIAAALPERGAAAKGGADACSRWGEARPGSITKGQARKATLCLINAERRQAGLRPLKRNKRLQRAAQRHNSRMAGSGCFAHECPGEGDLGSRLESGGYLLDDLRRWAFGENIAWGYGEKGSPSQAVEAWMNSPGHRANILSRAYREIGVGFSTGTPADGGEPGGIYTTDFGLRVG